MTSEITSFHPAFLGLVSSPIKFRMFLLSQLPGAFFSGLRVAHLSSQKAEVVVPYKWFTRNPFRSTYFVCLSMAAEMSTGILAMGYLFRRTPPVSMLVVSVEGKFYKKAVARTSFICNEGETIREAIQQAIDSGVPQTVRALSSGWNESNELVAEFWITWSFKVK